MKESKFFEKMHRLRVIQNFEKFKLYEVNCDLLKCIELWMLINFERLQILKFFVCKLFQVSFGFI